MMRLEPDEPTATRWSCRCTTRYWRELLWMAGIIFTATRWRSGLIPFTATIKSTFRLGAMSGTTAPAARPMRRGLGEAGTVCRPFRQAGSLGESVYGPALYAAAGFRAGTHGNGNGISPGGRIRITVLDSARFTLRLRIPAWCREWRLLLNGEGRPPQQKRALRRWNAAGSPGDCAVLELEMPPPQGLCGSPGLPPCPSDGRYAVRFCTVQSRRTMGSCCRGSSAGFLCTGGALGRRPAGRRLHRDGGGEAGNAAGRPSIPCRATRLGRRCS